MWITFCQEMAVDPSLYPFLTVHRQAQDQVQKQNAHVTAGARLERGCQTQARAAQSPEMSESFGVSLGLGVFPAVLHKK